jgi:hypothetical protein
VIEGRIGRGGTSMALLRTEELPEELCGAAVV